MNTIVRTYSSSFRKWLWVAIFAVFVIIHTPKDKVEIICEHGVDLFSQESGFLKNAIGDKDRVVWDLTHLAVRLKKIIFLISMVILLTPLIDSLKRTYFLWDPKKVKKRLIRSGIVFVFLSVLVFPIKLSGYGVSYARMSLSPFEMSSGWLYRRLFNPAIAHFLGFQGSVLYYILSLILTFVLIYFLIAYFEFQRIKINLIDILSITTCSFVILNFMAQGFPDPLMFIVFLIALIATNSYESRLAVITLGLVVHEASAFIFVPLILFVFPKKDAYKCFLVIALYFVLFLLSYMINLGDFMKTYILIGEKTTFEWMIEYPARVFGGWLASYKLLWIVIIYGIVKMFRSNDLRKGLCVVSIGVISPLVMNLLTFDVSRHVGWGSLALLMCYSYLMKRGYLKTALLRFIMLVNILIPSIYVGTNAGFRGNGGVGLYPWLYDISGLHRVLGGF
jgi:hypothetical protein